MKILFNKKGVFLLLALLVLSALPAIINAAYPLGDEVILYEFENDATNSGSGGATYDSALSGLGTAFTDTAKVGDYAVSFGASSNYVDTGYGTGINPTTNSVSISFWIYKTAACSSGNDDHVFGASGPVANTRMYIRCKADAWQYRLGGASEVPTGATATINGWNHIALILDASDDTAHMYINGTQRATSTIPSYTIGNDFYIGNFNDGVSLLEGGAAIIDEVAIYDRALSAGEVTTIYDESQLGVPDAPLNLETASFDGGVYMTWVAPVDIGGQAITDYKVEYKVSSSDTWLTFTDGVSTNRYSTVTGLTNGSMIDYEFRVSATNASGTGTSTSPVTENAFESVFLNSSTTASGTFTTSTLALDYSSSSTFPYLNIFGYDLKDTNTDELIATATTSLPGGAYDLNNLTAVIENTNLSLGTDTSAITYADVTGTFFTVHNGNGSIDEVTRTGELIRTITCSGCGDVEGIEWISSTVNGLGQHTHTFMTSYEGSGSSIRLTTISPGATSYSPGSMYNLGFGDLANLGLEGVAYDPDNDLYYIVREKTPVALYEVDLEGAPDVTEICSGQLSGISDLSDVDFSNGELFLLSHESSNVTRVTLDPCTVTSDVLDFTMTQAEGITWDSDGRNLYIVGEPDQFSRFTVGDLTFEGSISEVVEDGEYNLTTYITEPVGNSAISTVRYYVVDTTRPTPEITSTESSPTDATTIPISIDFGEDVSGFDISDITVGNGTAGDFAGGDQVFTANITPTAEGVVTVDIAENAATDDASLQSLAATQFSITYAIEAEESSSGRTIVSSGGSGSAVRARVNANTNADANTNNNPQNSARISEIVQLLNILGLEIPSNLEALLNSNNNSDQKCPLFVSNFRLGDQSPEVREIQLFLNRNLGTNLPGTNLFGPLTEGAVKQFQQNEFEKVLAPLGLTTPTGWWYQLSRDRANELSGC